MLRARAANVRPSDATCLMTTAGEGTRLLVMPEHDGLRLDQFLAAATTLSRRAARKLISDGAVARNGQPTRVLGRAGRVGRCRRRAAARPPSSGCRRVPNSSSFRSSTTTAGSWRSPNRPGCSLKPTRNRPPSSPSTSSRCSRLALEQGARPYLRLVHRLDRLTSGVALFARNPQAHAPLVRAWADGAVERRYLAVIEGDARDREDPHRSTHRPRPRAQLAIPGCRIRTIGPDRGSGRRAARRRPRRRRVPAPDRQNPPGPGPPRRLGSPGARRPALRFAPRRRGAPTTPPRRTHRAAPPQGRQPITIAAPFRTIWQPSSARTTGREILNSQFLILNYIALPREAILISWRTEFSVLGCRFHRTASKNGCDGN